MSAPAEIGRPEEALRRLAGELRGEETVITKHVVDTDDEPTLGILVAGGSRTREAPAEYALVVEAVREGYLLHYGKPRLLADVDADLALLAGDYLYALGLDRLARLGDLEAVAELSDLISLCAQLHARDAADDAGALWLATAVAIAVGPTTALREAKDAMRAEQPEAAAMLASAAAEAAAARGLAITLSGAAER